MQKRKIKWPTSIFLIGYHILLFGLLIFYLSYHGWPNWQFWIIIAVAHYLTMMGVTALYHRHYTHKSFTLNKAVEIGLLFLSTLALQSSVIRWAGDHKMHHFYTDSNKDPYNIKEGFWYAHFFWMLRKLEYSAPENLTCELRKNKLVMFQHKYYYPIAFFLNILFGLITGYIYQDYLGAFTFLVLLRLFLGHHATWSINSIAHYFGSKPNSKKESARNNFLLALITMGEGYHNYHHSYPADYRNGTKWYDFDPTKWFIWILSKLRLAKKLKKFSVTKIKTIN
jgi:stearoyl-CoA desaturase (Delta-9 desaturase)